MFYGYDVGRRIMECLCGGFMPKPENVIKYLAIGDEQFWGDRSGDESRDANRTPNGVMGVDCRVKVGRAGVF